MARRIVTLAEFEECVTGLGSPATARLVRALAHSIAENPTRAPRLDRLNVHVLRTRSDANHPALRIFYAFDEYAVYLLHVDRYDELSP